MRQGERVKGESWVPGASAGHPLRARGQHSVCALITVGSLCRLSRTSSLEEEGGNFFSTDC